MWCVTSPLIIKLANDDKLVWLPNLLKYDQLFNFDNHRDIILMVKALCYNNLIMW
jgi:hypothetical protein